MVEVVDIKTLETFSFRERVYDIDDDDSKVMMLQLHSQRNVGDTTLPYVDR